MTKTIKEWELVDVHGEFEAMEVMNTTKALEDVYEKNNPDFAVSSTARQSRVSSWEKDTLTSTPDSAYQGPHLTFPLSSAQVVVGGAEDSCEMRAEVRDVVGAEVRAEGRCLPTSCPYCHGWGGVRGRSSSPSVCIQHQPPSSC